MNCINYKNQESIRLFLFAFFIFRKSLTAGNIIVFEEFNIIEIASKKKCRI